MILEEKKTIKRKDTKYWKMKKIEKKNKKKYFQNENSDNKSEINIDKKKKYSKF